MRCCPAAVCIKKYCVTKFLVGRSNPDRGRIHFAFPNVQTGSEALPSTYSLDSFPWTMWVGREVDHSPPPSAEYKHEWNYTSAPPHIFMAWGGTTLCLLLFEFKIRTQQFQQWCALDAVVWTVARSNVFWKTWDQNMTVLPTVGQWDGWVFRRSVFHLRY